MLLGFMPETEMGGDGVKVLLRPSEVKRRRPSTPACLRLDDGRLRLARLRLGDGRIPIYLLCGCCLLGHGRLPSQKW